MMNEKYILAIESSCDDTSAAVLKGRKVLSNVIASQKVHEEYGGVVPELASREHQKNIVPVVQAALKRAEVDLSEIDAIACTQGPGLMGSLLVGVSFAKALALSRNIPLIGVHHMKAHILAHFIEDQGQTSELNFPFLCLTVSGGHTQIVRVDAVDQMKILGETIDDAAGEAFDKIAKIIGLPYPGGPLVDKLSKEGNPNAFKFSKSKVGEYDFSFSGLKTNALYFLQKQMKENPNFIEENLNDLCASVQHSIVEVLIEKTFTAAKNEGLSQVCIAGGVSANSLLRSRLVEEAEANDMEAFIPKFEYCTDNAAMIGITAHFKLEKELLEDQSLKPTARMPF